METRKRTSSKLVDDLEASRETKSSRKLRASVRQPKTTEQLLADPKNEIYDMNIADLVSILTSPEAQIAIAEQHPELAEQHRKLIEKPDLTRRSIANFKNDGKLGFHDPEWQRQAREAYRRHKQGDFDKYLKWKLYQDWPELERLDKAREDAETEAKAAQNLEKEQVTMDQDHVEKHEGNGEDQHMSGNSDIDHTAMLSFLAAPATSATPLTNGNSAAGATTETAYPFPPTTIPGVSAVADSTLLSPRATIPAAPQNISNDQAIPQESEALTNGHYVDSQPILNHHPAGSFDPPSNPGPAIEMPLYLNSGAVLLEQTISFQEVSGFLEPLESTD